MTESRYENNIGAACGSTKKYIPLGHTMQYHLMMTSSSDAVSLLQGCIKTNEGNSQDKSEDVDSIPKRSVTRC